MWALAVGLGFRIWGLGGGLGLIRHANSTPNSGRVTAGSAWVMLVRNFNRSGSTSCSLMLCVCVCVHEYICMHACMRSCIHTRAQCPMYVSLGMHIHMGIDKGINLDAGTCVGKGRSRQT